MCGSSAAARPRRLRFILASSVCGARTRTFVAEDRDPIRDARLEPDLVPGAKQPDVLHRHFLPPFAQRLRTLASRAV